MPDVAELGRKVKRKYPGAYDDLSDADLGRKVKKKYPGAYDDFTDTATPPGHGTLKNLALGAEQTVYGELVPSALSGLEALGAAMTGDFGPAKEIAELAGRGLISLGKYAPVSAGLGPAAAAQEAPIARITARRQAERQGDPIYGTVERVRQEVEQEAALDPSRRGRIERGVGRFATAAAPAVATGIATGGSIPAMTAVTAAQSLNAPENIPLAAGLGAVPLPVGQVFRAGINSIRRTFGKGAAQVIEAEAAPAAVAQVRREIGEVPPLTAEAPPVIGEAIPSPVAPAVDPLQSAFSKLGTDNVDQIGAMIANANRRLKKKNFTPEQRASAVADYKALSQLTPDENRALSQVLPMRNFAPITPTGTARDIQNIPMSELELDPQGAANLRHAMEFFDEQGRLLQAAEDAAIMGDVGPGATSGQMTAQPARVSAADLITTPPPATPSTIGDRIRTMARTPTSPVLVSDVRRQFPGLGKKEFDDEMVRLVEDEQIWLHRHDYPGSLTQAERDALVKIGDKYFSAATLREPPRISAETALPATIEAPSISGAAPSVRAASAGVTGPRVGADLDAMTVAAGGGARPPIADIDAPWLGGPAPQGQQQLFDAAARSPWQDTVLAYYRANLLTNPFGRAADLGSTIINQFADAAARPIAAAVDVIVSKFRGERAITGPSLSGTGRAFGSIRQGLRDVGEVMRTGRQAIDSGADDVLYGREIRSGLGGGFDVPVNGVFRFLGALDAPFRRFGFTRNLQDRARVAAINEAKRGRIPRDQTVARARELIDRHDIIQAAVRDGERAVLAEPNRISNWVAGQTRNNPNARLAFGLLQPFVRIPLNAAFKAADFAGIGGVKALYKIARGLGRKAKGQAFFRDLEEQRVFAQNVAAGSFGVAGFLLGMRLEEQGKLEGYFYTGRRDFPGRRVPTSIEIGGARYDIGRLGGFIFAPLFVGATYNRLRKEDVGKANALLRSFNGLVQQAPGLGYYGAPAKAGRILASDEPGGEMLKQAGEITSGFIPASGALGATAKFLDPAKRRVAEGFTGPIMAKIPGLREQLPITGNDAIDAAVDRNSPLLLELQRLGVRIAELQRKKDKEGKPEPDDLFNARVQQFGQNYTSYGLRLIQDPRFQIASDDVKARALKRLNEKAKGLTHKKFPFPQIELDPGLILDSVKLSK